MGEEGDLISHAASADGIPSRQFARLGEMLTEFPQAEGTRLVSLAEQSQGWSFLELVVPPWLDERALIMGMESQATGKLHSGGKEGRCINTSPEPNPWFCQKGGVRGKSGNV